MAKRRTSASSTKKPTAFREGQPFCPVHDFALYKAIRASPQLPPGAKVAWEALVEKTWKPNVCLDCSYDALARAIGLKRDQARRYVRKLILARLLKVTPRFRDGHQKSNHIEFIWRDPKIIEQGRTDLSSRKRGGPRVRVSAKG